MVAVEDFKGYALFAELSPGTIERLASVTRLRTFEKGHRIFRAQQLAVELFVIRSGRVEVYATTPEGGRPVIEVLETGAFFGSSVLVEPYRYRFATLALEDTEVLALDGQALRNLAADDHEVAYHLLRRVTTALCHRIEAACHLLHGLTEEPDPIDPHAAQP